ncbi:MAG: zf-HC2 domain-containing protein [Bacteroidetes bacterium]|nr:zf-HC2 domain-containing protein [Bacteroidota bacterium]
MSCIKEGLIQKYIDGETTQKETARIEKHIASCNKCSSRISERKLLAVTMKTTLNKLNESINNVVPFVNPSIRSGRKSVTLIRLSIIAASAACILLFAILLKKWSDVEVEKEIILSNSIENEIDANRTASQQEMTITVISEDGEVTEYQSN